MSEEDPQVGLVCFPCGEKYGRSNVNRNATWHIGKCEICKAEYSSVTDPRDFGHLRAGWSKGLPKTS